MTQGDSGPWTARNDSADSRPLDLEHLWRATLGDQALCREVLALFVDQVTSFKRQIGRASTAERLHLAHTLKGSARGIGAFPLAAGVAMLEQRPGDDLVLARLGRLIDEVCGFIAEGWAEGRA